MRCTLINPPFGLLICVVDTFFTMFGFGISLGSDCLEYGNDNRLAIIADGAIRRIIDLVSAFARCNGTLMLDIFIVFVCGGFACNGWFSLLEQKTKCVFNLEHFNALDSFFAQYIQF